MSERFDIHVCAVTKTLDDDIRNADALKEYCLTIDLFPKRDPQSAAPSDEDGRCRLVVQNASSQLSACVKRRISSVDLVHAEGFYMIQHVPVSRDPRVPVLLTEQNLEFQLWRQRAHLAHGINQRTPLVMEYLRTLRDETATWEAVDVVGTVTEDDRRNLLATHPSVDVRVLPDGVDHLRSEPVRGSLPPNPRPRIAFIANFAYEPNVDAALYLGRELLPRIARAEPEVQLWLVGNNPPQEIWNLASGSVVVTGTVPDVEAYLDAADVIVCPLRVGGGIKVKVLEAMFRGKPVVTTTVGAQGLGRTNGALAVHDETTRLARAVLDLLHHPERRRRMGAAARAFALTLPTWDDAATAVQDAYVDLLEARQLSVHASSV